MADENPYQLPEHLRPEHEQVLSAIRDRGAREGIAEYRRHQPTLYNDGVLSPEQALRAKLQVVEALEEVAAPFGLSIMPKEEGPAATVRAGEVIDTIIDLIERSASLSANYDSIRVPDLTPPGI